MAFKQIAPAVLLGIGSFGLGWMVTSNLAQRVEKEDVVTVTSAAGKVAPNRSPGPTTRTDDATPDLKTTKATLRANDNAVAAIAAVGRDDGLRGQPTALAYAPSDGADTPNRTDSGNIDSGRIDLAIAPPPTPAPPSVDMSGIREAIALFRKGDQAGGDAIGRTRRDPVARTTVEWLSIRTNPRAAGFARIMAFLNDHRDWPAAQWLRRKAEETIFGDKRDAGAVLAFFERDRPVSPFGELALARALRQTGRPDEAATLVRGVWRKNDLSSPALEASIVREFGDLLTVADHKYRADKLLYREQASAALRAAERAGPGVMALAKARYAVAKSTYGSGLLLDLVPAGMRSDPGYLFARIQYLRRGGKTDDAVKLMLSAPRDREVLVDGDAWWTERRLLARKLLDAGDIATAYRLCAENSAVSHDDRVEAEFHAGWIALRFLHDPRKAAPHFVEVSAQADTPADVARGAYWQGRTAEAMGDSEAAARFYAAGATHTATYYGQLALAKRPSSAASLRSAPAIAQGEARNEAVKVAEVLYAVGEPDLALPLVIEGVQHLSEQSQVAAMGAVVSGYRDARATLLVGKLASVRGFALDDFAFPTFGIPSYQPVAKSADRSVVYAIARQESAFQPRVVSSAGAKGLMQLMTPTARVAAARAGLGFNEAWLTSDPAFNAKLGAAHLADLMGEQNGSYILTFAAYNAGGGAVKKWISAYGDPRNPDVDPIDWVELIPFTETRHYVQTVMENMEMYQLRFGGRSAMLIDRDLRRSGS